MIGYWKNLFAILAALAVAGSACSVSTPRHTQLSASAARSSVDQLSRSSDADGTDALDGTGEATGTSGVQDATSGSPTATGGRTLRGTAASSSRATTGTAAHGTSGTSGASQSAAGGNVVGVTPNSITVSVSMPFSSTLGPYYQPLYENGVVAWANEVNANGGIRGRKVLLKKVDDAGTAQGGVAACKIHRSNGSFVTLGVSAPENEADCMDQAGKPMFMAVTTRESPSWRRVRALIAHPLTGIRLVEMMRSPLLPVTGKKIGVIYNGDDVTMNEMWKTYSREARKAGQNIVAVKRINNNQASFVAELQTMRSAGAEVVSLLVQLEAVGIVRDSKAIGYNPIFTGATWCADEFSKAGGDLMQGLRCVRPAPPVDLPAFKQYQRTAAKYGSPSLPITGYTAFTYGSSVILGKALEAAGPTLNSETFNANVEKLQGIEIGILPRVTFGGGRTVGAPGAFPVVCCDGARNFKSLGPAQDRF